MHVKGAFADRYRVLFVEFYINIHVYRLGKGHKGSMSTTNKQIRRVFKLLYIACKVLASYCAVPKTVMAATFVSFNCDVLSCSFLLSLALPDVCVAVVQEWNNNCVSWRYSENSICKVGSYGLTVDKILSYKCKIGDAMKNNLMLLLEAEYYIIMHEAGTGTS